MLIIEASLLRSVLLSLIVDDDTTGADKGRGTVLEVVRSRKFSK